MRWVLLLVMAAGCRQLFGLDSPVERDAAVDDTAIDGPRDAQGGTCVERWIAGPEFALQRSLAINSGTQDRKPFVTPDGQNLYYVHDNDVFLAPFVTNDFANPAREVSLSSGNGDGRVFVAADGLRAFLSSNRNGGIGGGADLWRGTRADPTAAWSLDQMYLANLNAAGDQSDPALTADLLHIYYSSKGTGLLYAERPGIADAFGAPTPLAALNGSVGEDEMPTVTGDERVIVFESTRSGNSELWYATRAVNTPGFDPPKLVPAINNPQRIDESPHISQDGCTLYFTSDRAGSLDIYVTTLLD